jgi:hypothetical protein
MADNICEQLGDKVRDGAFENGAVADGKISKNKIVRYVKRTRASELKNLEDFDNDKEKFMKHIRLSDKEPDKKKQKTEHASALVPWRPEDSSMAQMLQGVLAAQATQTAAMIGAMQTASADAAKVSAESMEKLVVLLAGKTGVTVKAARAPKKAKSVDAGGKSAPGGKVGAPGGKSGKVLKAEAKAAFDNAQSVWDATAKGEQEDALGESAALGVHDAFLATKNNGTLRDVLDQMNATWREKLGGGDGMAIIENTPEHVRSVADFNQR